MTDPVDAVLARRRAEENAMKLADWQRIDRLARMLADQGVEPGSMYCNASSCRHPGGVHSGLTNRCLVCDCPGFSSGTPASDLAVALRIALDQERLPALVGTKEQTHGLLDGSTHLFICTSCGERLRAWEAGGHDCKPADPGSVHIFGHHAKDVDPWDALLADVRALEAPDQVYTSLVCYWRTEARQRLEDDGK